MTDLNKEREAFEKISEIAEILNEEKSHFNGDFYDLPFNSCAESFINGAWYAWQEKAKAQAVPEHIITLQRNGEVFKFDLLDLLRRSLKSSKVLKTRENWSHVSKMVGLGSTTATLLCKEMNVDPDGTVFVASESGAEG
ncbi:hypothetical protein [Acinetobacter baumannii]|uniref:hypothetical protein n=1 Tax=Acinetobacter baumannii TaxID=470 RepID=UPI0038797A9E